MTGLFDAWSLSWDDSKSLPVPALGQIKSELYLDCQLEYLHVASTALWFQGSQTSHMVTLGIQE